MVLTKNIFFRLFETATWDYDYEIHLARLTLGGGMWGRMSSSSESDSISIPLETAQPGKGPCMAGFLAAGPDRKSSSITMSGHSAYDLSSRFRLERRGASRRSLSEGDDFLKN